MCEASEDISHSTLQLPIPATLVADLIFGIIPKNETCAICGLRTLILKREIGGRPPKVTKPPTKLLRVDLHFIGSIIFIENFLRITALLPIYGEPVVQ